MSVTEIELTDVRIAVQATLLASSVDANVFVATKWYRISAIREVHSAAGGSGAAVTVRKCAGTTAPSSGTAVHSGSLGLTGAANTVASATLANNLMTLTLAPGDRLAADFSGTLTGLVGTLTIELDPLPTPAPLTWAPPTLSSPQTIQPNSTGYQQFNLSANTDYIVEMPAALKPGGLTLVGGRNIVLIGGKIEVQSNPTIDAERRALYLKGQTGTVHVEGLSIHRNASDTDFDGVVMHSFDTPAGIYQLQNIRIEGIEGAGAGWHGDAVQVILPANEQFTGKLRVDRMTVGSSYQSFYLPVDGDGHHSLKRLNSTMSAGDSAAYWFGDNTDDAEWGMKNVDLEEVYVVPRPGNDFEDEFQPNSGATITTNRPVIRDGIATWPNAVSYLITGELREGHPPGGDFVPATSVGVGYVNTVGYLG